MTYLRCSCFSLCFLGFFAAPVNSLFFEFVIQTHARTGGFSLFPSLRCSRCMLLTCRALLPQVQQQAQELAPHQAGHLNRERNELADPQPAQRFFWARFFSLLFRTPHSSLSLRLILDQLTSLPPSPPHDLLSTMPSSPPRAVNRIQCLLGQGRSLLSRPTPAACVWLRLIREEG